MKPTSDDRSRDRHLATVKAACSTYQEQSGKAKGCVIAMDSDVKLMIAFRQFSAWPVRT